MRSPTCNYNVFRLGYRLSLSKLLWIETIYLFKTNNLFFSDMGEELQNGIQCAKINVTRFSALIPELRFLQLQENY
jgi:hypothetical protein